ncbi:MAG: SGNH/GDSL hydrolase family protein [Clostridia bacterium]|nr:SGNH/GDSL hydrolase family protein [Clostridia bacterium]
MKKFIWMILVVLLVLSMATLSSAAYDKDDGTQGSTAPEATILADDITNDYDEDTNYVLNVELTGVGTKKDENGESIVHSLSYDIALTANGVKVEPRGDLVTFLLPVPSGVEVGTVVHIYREGEYYSFAEAKEIDGRKCVKITASEFGIYILELVHEHKYTSEVIEEPTCTETGIKNLTCGCGDTHTEVIEALGHTADAATDCLNGLTCTVCGEILEGELGHSYEAVVTPPTCTEVGYTTYICDCGYSYTGDAVSAIGHDYIAVVTAPTCTVGGYTTHICSECSDSYTDTTTAATGHSFSGDTCVSCGYVIKPETIVLADRAGGSTPQTGGGDFFGQRFDIGSNTLKQLVITNLATYTNNVNTWEIKFWQWDTNQPITVQGTPIYTKTGSNHIDSTDFIIDIPDNITLSGVIYYEIYYRSGSTGFAGWDALGSHADSLHTYVNGNEVNTHIASYIKIMPSTEPEEPETNEPTDGLHVKQDDLKEIMQSVFGGTVSLKETVMFIDKNTTKDLLFPINSVVSVTSYDGKITYLEGRDYVIENGQLKITANSTMPCITSATYYNHSDSMIQKDGKNLYWGEGQMKQWQVSVTYTHAEGWGGFEQESQLEVYEDFVQKLINGEDVTVMFYGDSITWGACSTYTETVQPKQGAYSMLFTEALADLFGYRVKYINTGLSVPGAMACHTVPTTDYVAGDRGTITYINTAIGGWTSNDGVNNFNQHIKAQVNTYGCDLLVLAFGMNDGGYAPSETKANDKTIIDNLFALTPDAAVMIVSTMTPHTGSNWDSNNIKNQETQLLDLAATYRSSGKAVAVAQVNSVSKAVQERKTFNDYAGNNINHPNDWFYRVYAQTLLQTLIGYENMD